MPNYTIWPAPADVRAMLATTNVALPSAVTNDLIQLRIDSAVQTLTKKTLNRQFLVTTEQRFFDGSGNGEMVIDEYRNITQIDLFLVPTMSVTSISQFFQVERAKTPRTRIQIYQGPPNVPFGWFTYFPEGRANVGITGTWGYDDTIPADVWEAVLGKAAGDLLDVNRLSASGLQTDLKMLDDSIKFDPRLLSMVSGWEGKFKAVCVTYRRPMRQFMAQRYPQLI